MHNHDLIQIYDTQHRMQLSFVKRAAKLLQLTPNDNRGLTGCLQFFITFEP
jgi:hypothetical protein